MQSEILCSRTTMSNTKKYTAAPSPPTDETIRRRYEAILAILAGTQTVAGAARTLALPRNHFQTIMHRGIEGLIAGITPRPTGRPAKPARELELEAENARLKAKLAAMEEHSDAEIAARLFPDQATFKREEQRRFELLEAHWDVPLELRPLEG
jgi:hypothetical protein